MEPGHSVSALLSFFHTSGRRCRWFLRWYYGTPVVFSAPFLLLSPFPPSSLTLSFSLSLSLSFSVSLSLLSSSLLSRPFLRPFSFDVLRIPLEVQSVAQDSRRVFFFDSKMILFREKVSGSLHIAQIADVEHQPFVSGDNGLTVSLARILFHFSDD